MADTPVFTDKFIAFVDVLGFKAMVQAAEAGTGPPLPELMKLMRKLGTKADRNEFRRRGPLSCPDAPRIRDDMDFELTQISDCVIISTEVSPAGVINLIWHCWGACMKLLGDGVMLRGYIKRGTSITTRIRSTARATSTPTSASAKCRCSSKTRRARDAVH